MKRVRLKRIGQVNRREWLVVTGGMAGIILCVALSGCTRLIDSVLTPFSTAGDAINTETKMAGRSDVEKTPPRPSRYTVAADPLILHTNQKISPDAPVVRESRMLRLALVEAGMPATVEPIHIYLFDSESDFLAYAHSQIPGFADRRAFFMQRAGRLEILTFQSDDLPTDLRHEVVHGYLHAAIPELPLWLDEGLAEYLEVPSGQHGRHAEHESLFRQRGIDSLRPMTAAELDVEIHSLSLLTDPGAMTAFDYARSWRVLRQLTMTETGHDRLRTMLSAHSTTAASAKERSAAP